jgi:hypothetical protein
MGANIKRCGEESLPDPPLTKGCYSERVEGGCKLLSEQGGVYTQEMS